LSLSVFTGSVHNFGVRFLFALLCGVGQRHKAVSEMHVFNVCIGEIEQNIVMREVPERVYAKRHKLFNCRLCVCTGNTKHRHSGLVLGAELFKHIGMLYFDTAYLNVFHGRIAVEYSRKLIAIFRKIYVHCQRTSEITCTDENYLFGDVYAKYLSDLIAKLGDIIAVALLSEAAEAVEVLAYLRGGKAHHLGKLSRGYFGDVLFQKLTEKAVITGKSAYYGV